MTPRILFAILAPALMRGAAGIEGRILEDHSGSPVASANIRISKLGQRFLAADLETSGDGKFDAPDLGAGDYRIEVIKPNYIATSIQLHVAEANAAVSIRLVRCAVIRGRVVNSEGQPILGATIFAIPKPDPGMPLRPRFQSGENRRLAHVGEGGRYRIFNLPPGQYALVAAYGAYTMAVGMVGAAQVNTATGSGFLFYPQNAHPDWFSISGGEDLQNIDFTIAPAAPHKVSGKVMERTTLAQYWMALAPVDNPAIAIAVTMADREGSFHFDAIPAGSYELFASGPTRSRNSDGGFMDPDHRFARTRVDVNAQDVEGISLSPEKGPSATFIVESQGKCAGTPQVILTALEDWGNVVSVTESTPLGVEKTVTDLAPSRYMVRVTGTDDCYGPLGAILDLTGGSRKLTLKLAPAASIHGKLDAKGFVVVLLGGDAVQFATPGAAGKFTFNGLRPGKYRIAARPADGAPQSRWVADLPNLVEIEIRPGASIDVDLAAPETKK